MPPDPTDTNAPNILRPRDRLRSGRYATGVLALLLALALCAASVAVVAIPVVESIGWR